MSSFQHKPGKGSLLTNLRRDKETSPHYTGKLCIDRDLKVGETINIVAWEKENHLGKILTLSISRPPQQTTTQEVKDDSEIPF